MTNTKEIIKDYLKKGYHCIGEYKGERVRIESYDRDGLTIFIPSRQESVYVSFDKVELLKAER